MRGTIGYRLLTAMGLRQNQPWSDDFAQSGIIRAPWLAGKRVQDIRTRQTKKVWVLDPNREWWERNKGEWKEVEVSTEGKSRGDKQRLANAVCNTLLAQQ